MHVRPPVTFLERVQFPFSLCYGDKLIIRQLNEQNNSILAVKNKRTGHTDYGGKQPTNSTFQTSCQIITRNG